MGETQILFRSVIPRMVNGVNNMFTMKRFRPTFGKRRLRLLKVVTACATGNRKAIYRPPLGEP
jgi:hypothetical protein